MKRKVGRNIYCIKKHSDGNSASIPQEWGFRLLQVPV